MADEVETVSRLVAMEGQYHGHDGVRRWWENLLGAYPDLSVEVVEAPDLGDFTLIHQLLRGRGAVAARHDPPVQRGLLRTDSGNIRFQNASKGREEMAGGVSQRANPAVAGFPKARPAGFEPATSRSGGERSIH
jgi:hypothetical protein